MGLHLAFYLPHPALRAHATLHYVFRADGQPFETLFGAMLPQVQRLIVGSCEVRVGERPWAPLEPVSLSGPSNAAVRARGSGDFVMVGTGLRPAGLTSLVREPAVALSDGLIDAGALWGDRAARAEGLLDADPACDQALVAAADRALLGLLACREGRIDPRVAVIDAWLSAAHRVDVDHLSTRLGLSGRQVERLTAATHGGSPRLLLTKHRALRAAARLALGEVEGWESAADGGYADQPHFIRRFSRFVGVTPGRYVRDGGAAMARAAYAGRARAGAADPLALWS